MGQNARNRASLVVSGRLFQAPVSRAQGEFVLSPRSLPEQPVESEYEQGDGKRVESLRTMGWGGSTLESSAGSGGSGGRARRGAVSAADASASLPRGVTRHKYDRPHLVSNNSRFLNLPGYHYPNLASRILSLCERRLVRDWPQRFGHPLLLLETFVDPSRFRGTIYRAANWLALGHTLGFRRTRGGYSQFPATPKQVWAIVSKGSNRTWVVPSETP